MQGKPSVDVFPTMAAQVPLTSMVKWPPRAEASYPHDDKEQTEDRRSLRPGTPQPRGPAAALSGCRYCWTKYQIPDHTCGADADDHRVKAETDPTLAGLRPFRKL